MAAILEDRRKSWQDLIERVDMTQNSKRAWSTIKRSTMTTKRPHCTAMSQQTSCSSAASKWETTTQNTPQKGKKAMWGHGVNMAVYRWGIRRGNWQPKERQSRWPGWHPHWTNQTPWSKVAPLAVQQLCNPLQLPKIWRKGSGYRHPETWERSTWSKSYRPISLLCHLFKLLRDWAWTGLAQLLRST